MAGGVWTDPVDVGIEAVPTTLLTNIADDLRCLYKGGGQGSPSAINASSSIDIGSTYDTFKIVSATYPYDVYYISTTGRNLLNKIWFINTGDNPIQFWVNGGSPGAGYAKIVDPASPIYATIQVGGTIGLIYSGTAWHIMRSEY